MGHVHRHRGLLRERLHRAGRAVRMTLPSMSQDTPEGVHSTPQVCHSVSVLATPPLPPLVCVYWYRQDEEGDEPHALPTVFHRVAMVLARLPSSS
jgi:hypothetical protein